jgi:hypothetical protein
MRALGTDGRLRQSNTGDPRDARAAKYQAEEPSLAVGEQWLSNTPQFQGAGRGARAIVDEVDFAFMRKLILLVGRPISTGMRAALFI